MSCWEVSLDKNIREGNRTAPLFNRDGDSLQEAQKGQKDDHFHKLEAVLPGTVRALFTKPKEVFQKSFASFRLSFLSESKSCFFSSFLRCSTNSIRKGMICILKFTEMPLSFLPALWEWSPNLGVSVFSLGKHCRYHEALWFP